MLIMQNLCHYYLVVPYYDSYYRIIICVPPHQCTLSKHLIIIIIITIIMPPTTTTHLAQPWLPLQNDGLPHPPISVPHQAAATTALKREQLVHLA